MSCYCKSYVSPPRGAIGWSAVCDLVFPDHTHLLFEVPQVKKDTLNPLLCTIARKSVSETQNTGQDRNCRP